MRFPETPSGKELLKEHSAYHVSWDESVFRYFHADMIAKIDNYLSCFARFNEKYKITSIKPELLPDLPFNLDTRFWRERQKDVKWILQAAAEKTEVLELGSWNGWLANTLSKAGHSVTSVDYFLNESHGLKARRYYPTANWTSINMDVDDIDHLVVFFDLVIFNRCISYYSDFEGVLRKAVRLLNPGGRVILTGLNVVSELDGANAFYDQTNEIFQQEFGISMEIKPNSKKMLADSDLETLKDLGFKVYSNDLAVERFLKKNITRKRSRSYSAMYTKVG